MVAHNAAAPAIETDTDLNARLMKATSPRVAKIAFALPQTAVTVGDSPKSEYHHSYGIYRYLANGINFPIGIGECVSYQKAAKNINRSLRTLHTTYIDLVDTARRGNTILACTIHQHGPDVVEQWAVGHVDGDGDVVRVYFYDSRAEADAAVKDLLAA